MPDGDAISRRVTQAQVVSYGESPDANGYVTISDEQLIRFEYSKMAGHSEYPVDILIGRNDTTLDLFDYDKVGDILYFRDYPQGIKDGIRYYAGSGPIESFAMTYFDGSDDPDLTTDNILSEVGATIESGIGPMIYVASNAIAPIVTIMPIPDGDEMTDVDLVANVVGGVYDEITFTWSGVTAGGYDIGLSGTGQTYTWTRPSVTLRTVVYISCVVSVSGTGIIAADGSSDSDTVLQVTHVDNV